MGWLKLRWPDHWADSAVNPWGFALEQRSADGLFRHRTVDDWMRPTEWERGPHPIAESLRSSGKAETDNFSQLAR